MKQHLSTKEKNCMASFSNETKFWHVYTNGRETAILFATDEEFTFAMNVVAQSSFIFKSIKIIAFEIMSNHFHFVLSSKSEIEINMFFRFIKKRISRFIPAIRNVELSLKQIDNLNSLRNNIVYTNRNGYVSNTDYTPFSYPWGTGKYYFQDIPCQKQYSDINIVQRRLMFRGRAPELPDDWRVINGLIVPTSFCSISLGMSMFRDAHHYFSMISKNVESYREIASELDDEEFMTDSELYNLMYRVVNEEYQLSSIHELTKSQKLDLAKTLRFKYRSSNGQICRLTGLSQYDINQLFPLSAKY